MPQRVKLHDKVFRKMISAEQIHSAMQSVVSSLNERYAESTPVFLGVLNGSFLFIADLVRMVDFPCEMAFVSLSSYCGTESMGEVSLQMDVQCDIAGRDVIIVEDVVDTGQSMKFLLEHLQSKQPRSVAICTLFFKPEKFKFDFKVDYPVMNIGNEFIVGYGLDYNELGRNLKDIYVIDE